MKNNFKSKNLLNCYIQDLRSSEDFNYFIFICYYCSPLTIRFIIVISLINYYFLKEYYCCFLDLN